MRYYLYTFEDIWANEMNVAGFMILNELEKDSLLTQIKKEFKKGGSISFGTNEDNEYDSLQDVMNCITIKEISKTEYDVIKKTLGTSFGETGPANIIEEDDEEDYEDDEEEQDSEEEIYKANVDRISAFIEKEYSLVNTPTLGLHSKFIWKPTSKTEIEITIPKYDSNSGEEEVELNLKHGRRGIDYHSLDVEEISVNPEHYLKSVIKSFIEKAKKY